MEENDNDQKEDETQETNGQSKPGKTASAVCVTESGDFHPMAIENYSRMTSHLARGRLRRRHAAGLCAYLLTAGADTFDIFQEVQRVNAVPGPRPSAGAGEHDGKDGSKRATSVRHCRRSPARHDQRCSLPSLRRHG